jgi:bilirubin oxidase
LISTNFLGLLSHPVNTKDLFMSMGERYEIIVDFANHAGKNFTMRNGRQIGENADYAATDMVMRFVVGDTVTDNTNNGDVPQSLRAIPATSANVPVKDFAFERKNGEWVINGVGFSDIEHRILTRPVQGSDEIWTLRNAGGGGTHPVHIHLVDFQITSRTGGRNSVMPYESAGRKDVVYLAPGETVQVIARYAPWAGVYMFHCHNLIHEDHELVLVCLPSLINTSNYHTRMLDAFNVTQLAKWGYTNDTIFIDPMQPEFLAKPVKAADYTDEAIRSKIAWFYSTNAYHHGDSAGVYSKGSASATGPVSTPLPSVTQPVPSYGNASVTVDVSSSWTTMASSTATTSVPVR